jgi:hypothetical protein
MIVTEIRCDECDAYGDSSTKNQKAHILRKGLKAQGWLVGMAGGKDLCQKCQKERTKKP